MDKDQILNILITFLSSLLAILVSLWIERKRLPNLEISVSEDANTDNTYQSPHPRAGERWKFFRVKVSNKKFPFPFAWIPRYGAENCTTEITFSKIGTELKKFTMKGRWVSTLELTFLSAEQAFIKVLFPDSVSIIPGGSEILDIFTKCENDKEAYGWNNEAYLNNWKQSNHKLERGKYCIKVIITTKNGSIFRKDLTANIADKINDTNLINS